MHPKINMRRPDPIFGRRGVEQWRWASPAALTSSSVVRAPAQGQSEGTKLSLILLFTRDRNFEQLARAALFGTGATVLTAQDVRQALEIVCQRGRELDFALLDFDAGCRGMTLLSALHTCHQQLPILVTTSNDAEHSTAIAYANGALACLNKPLPAERLAHAIADLKSTHPQGIAA